MWGEGVREVFVKNEELKLALEVDSKYIAFVNSIKRIYLWLSGRLLVFLQPFLPALVHTVHNHRVIL